MQLTEKDIVEIAESFGMNPDDTEIAHFLRYTAGFLGAHEAVLGAPASPAPEPPERDWWFPDANPLGAWYVRTDLDGAAAGPLEGQRVAIKDNVFVAGVPMMNGTRILEGFEPSADASVVTRLLDAGARILGKSVCEAYCMSGGSHTSESGPVRNPHAPDHSAGGSSSGSAALVAAGEVDLAIGCDQGGSIRMPASFCGICGMKPTHALVPYTGILGMDPEIDHVGPMTRDVRSNALMLEVLAGPDGLDSRQANLPDVPRYSEALGEDLDGVRIGLLAEGFGQAGAEADVEACVRAAARRLEACGATLAEISVPAHRLGSAIGGVLVAHSLDVTFGNDGMAPGRSDPVAEDFVARQRSWRERADDLPIIVRSLLIATAYARRRFGSASLARATNLVRRLRAEYDAALEQVDLLLMPTTPMKASVLPSPGADPGEIVARGNDPLPNTMPFDHTHHPAMSVPCGMREGLPVGMMLVGRRFEEHLIYRAAYAFEQQADWRSA